MGRFASTVVYYESARAPYGAAFFTAAAQRLGLDRSQRLLDVSAGPGILAIGFRPYCREVVGVDPEPGMIKAARAAADRADVAITFIEGRFEDVAQKLGAFDAVTIGRAIHWLDPGPARAALDRVLASQGKVLVCHASRVRARQASGATACLRPRGGQGGARSSLASSPVSAASRSPARCPGHRRCIA